MDTIDPDAVDGKLETERQWLVASLRWVADRLEGLTVEEVIEPLTLLADDAEAFLRRARTVLQVPRGTPPPHLPPPSR